jgi:hypothetical protein
LPSTLPDSPAPGKPVSRAWLYGPYIALIVAIVLWSGAWLVIRGRVAAQLDAAASSPPSGPSLAWDHRRITGYPFRIEVILDNVRASEPSGWTVQAGQIRAETYAYELKHWIAYAPHGVVLNRPAGAGPVTISGQALRASVVRDAPGQTRVSIEGLNLSFAPAPGAKLFPITAVHQIDAHTRPAGADQTEFLIQIQGARAAPGTIVARLAGDQPFDSAWHGTLSKASALSGRGWPDAARAWRAAGGAVTLLGGDLTAGPVRLNVGGGQLDVGSDGRLTGQILLDLPTAPAALAAFGHAGAIDLSAAHALTAVVGPSAKADLTFQAGETSFGPVAIGPAPRIY